jgi:putative thioredoxin
LKANPTFWKQSVGLKPDLRLIFELLPPIWSHLKADTHMTSCPYIFDSTQTDFEESVLLASTQQPVLVDFWAPWCGPCKQLTPIIEKVVTELKGKVLLAKVNTDEQGQLAAAFGIRSLPTVMLIKDGRPLDGFMGVQPESVIKEWLAPHIKDIAEPEAEAIEEIAIELSPEEQVQAARAAIRAEPEKAELKLDLILALLLVGDSDAAQTELDALPLNLENHDTARRARSQLAFAKALKDAPDERTLSARLLTKEDDHLARYQFGVRRLIAGDAESAIEAFIEIMRRDRKFEDDLGRKSLIAAFPLIDDADLVSRTRKRMAAMIF